jgi:nicotinamidase-related amidase
MLNSLGAIGFFATIVYILTKESTMRLEKENTILLVVDVQERLIPHIHNHEVLIENIQTLLQGFKHLEIPMILNEQYKKGLGETLPEVKSHLEGVKSYEKVTFSCCQNTPTLTHVLESGRKIAVVIGAETHVCVMQTCLDLLSSGVLPVVIVDCVGSRKPLDYDIALRRMEKTGVVLATLESILFELCKSSKDPAFKAISELIK